MQYKAAIKTTLLITLSLASIILLYFAVEPITNYFNETGHIGLSVLSNASLAIMIYFLVRWFNKKQNGLTINEYGFGSKRVLTNFLIGALVAIFLVSMTLFWTSFLNDSQIEFIGLTNNISLIEFLMANLVVAAWEEIYFRGLVVNTLLKQKLSFTWTTVISSGLFTVVHFASYDLETITPYWMAGVFFISTILLILYVLTRSIWTSIGCHFVWDSLFMSLDKNENNFGIIEMTTYARDTVLIDNISILVTGVVLFLFFIFMRNRIKALIRQYVSKVAPQPI